MRNIPIYSAENHKFILLNESEPGEEDGIRSNQYLIVDGDHGVLLDPGGFGVMPRVLSELLKYVSPDKLKAIILSHQDPDIVGGIATWLEISEAPVYVSSIWMRFLPHYGVSSMQRFVGVPDEGMQFELAAGFNLALVPAHFLHSEGQINVYDPIAKVLFSGDIGAAMMPDGEDFPFVDDFAAHLPQIVEGVVAAAEIVERKQEALFPQIVEKFPHVRHVADGITLKDFEYDDARWNLQFSAELFCIPENAPPLDFLG